MALVNPKDAGNIYNSSEWESRRRQEKEWHAWFTGDKILDDMAELPDDLGQEQPRYLIGVTLVAQYAEVHRDVLFGIPPNTDANPVTILLSSKNKALAAPGPSGE